MPLTIRTPALPNLPWENRPKDTSEVLWRFSTNPVIRRDHLPTSNSIFNSAVIPIGDGFAGVFRVDNKAVQMRIHVGFSTDALNWKIDPAPLVFQSANPEISKMVYGYDPRVTQIGNRFYINLCNV